MDVSKYVTPNTLDYPMNDLKGTFTHYNKELGRNITSEEEQEYYKSKGELDNGKSNQSKNV